MGSARPSAETTRRSSLCVLSLFSLSIEQAKLTVPPRRTVPPAPPTPPSVSAPVALARSPPWRPAVPASVASLAKTRPVRPFLSLSSLLQGPQPTDSTHRLRRLLRFLRCDLQQRHPFLELRFFHPSFHQQQRRRIRYRRWRPLRIRFRLQHGFSRRRSSAVWYRDEGPLWRAKRHRHGGDGGGAAHCIGQRAERKRRWMERCRRRDGRGVASCRSSGRCGGSSRFLIVSFAPSLLRPRPAGGFSPSFLCIDYVSV